MKLLVVTAALAVLAAGCSTANTLSTHPHTNYDGTYSETRLMSVGAEPRYQPGGPQIGQDQFTIRTVSRNLPERTTNLYTTVFRVDTTTQTPTINYQVTESATAENREQANESKGRPVTLELPTIRIPTLHPPLDNDPIASALLIANPPGVIGLGEGATWETSAGVNIAALEDENFEQPTRIDWTTTVTNVNPDSKQITVTYSGTAQQRRPRDVGDRIVAATADIAISGTVTFTAGTAVPYPNGRIDTILVVTLDDPDPEQDATLIEQRNSHIISRTS